MKLHKLAIVASTVTFLSGCIVIATPSHADYRAQKSLSLQADGLEEFEIKAGAGKLHVTGEEGLTEILVEADIYTESSNPENYIFELTERNGEALLIAKMKSTSGSWVGSSPHMDVTVRMPANLKLDLEDGSGELTVSNINASVEIDDGSGDIVVSKINGTLEIDDGSGELTVSEVNGDTEIEDGSGDMKVSMVNGSLSVDDGSGDFTAKDISGVVTINDGSGDITVKGAGGLKILDDGSGSLKVKDVRGGFEIDS